VNSASTVFDSGAAPRRPFLERVLASTTAHNFAGHPPYMMVVRTRDGLPVKSISSYSSEDEVVLPMGTHLRCVKVDHKGISGRPTVYMVAEDLVAEADSGTGGGATKAA
jgi:hypothetical protein